MKIKKQIIDFLKKNGWKEVDNYIDEDDNYIHLYKDNNVSIDIDDEEIIIIDDTGDIFHIGLVHFSKYALLGFLINNHMISIDYKW